jgi:predicted esterase
MSRIVSIAIALSIFALPLRAQDPAARAQDPAGRTQDPAPKVDSARTYVQEFQHGVDELRAKHWEAGIASMKRCMQISPEDPSCAYNLACAHALQNQLEPGIEWFQKCASWGFGYDGVQDLLGLAETDTDLDALRKDPRFAAAMDTIRARKNTTEAFVMTPAVYVPSTLDKERPMPVLVVLHASGSTKDAVIAGRWKEIADQFGCALIAPSARVLVGRDPARGMVWWTSFADYAQPDRSLLYETSIDSAFDAFAKQHPIDKSRVFIAGDQEGGMVAMHHAFAHPERWKGVVSTEAAFEESLVKPNAEAAKKAGLKVKVLIDRDAFAKRLAADPSRKIDPAEVLSAWTDHMEKLGFPGAIETWTKEAPSQTSATTSPTDPLTTRIVADLRAMQPTTVEAASPK